jgi:hypothetical protein
MFHHQKKLEAKDAEQKEDKAISALDRDSDDDSDDEAIECKNAAGEVIFPDITAHIAALGFKSPTVKENEFRNGVCYGNSFQGDIAAFLGQFSVYKQRLDKLLKLDPKILAEENAKITPETLKHNLLHQFIAWDLIPYFNSVMLNQGGMFFSYLYPLNTFTEFQQADKSSVLTLPSEFIDKHGVVEKPITESNMFSLDELTMYLQLIQIVLNRYKDIPFPLMLNSNAHSVHVFYDATQGGWYFTDIGDLTKNTMMTSSQLAQEIFNGFNSDKYGIFSRILYVPSKSHDVYQKINQEIVEATHFLRPVTPEKLAEKSKIIVSLNNAILTNDVSRVNAIIENQEFSTMLDRGEFSADEQHSILGAVLQGGRLDLLNLLVSKGFSLQLYNSWRPSLIVTPFAAKHTKTFTSVINSIPSVLEFEEVLNNSIKNLTPDELSKAGVVAAQRGGFNDMNEIYYHAAKEHFQIYRAALLNFLNEDILSAELKETILLKLGEFKEREYFSFFHIHTAIRNKLSESCSNNPALFIPFVKKLPEFLARDLIKNKLTIRFDGTYESQLEEINRYIPSQSKWMGLITGLSVALQLQLLESFDLFNKPDVLGSLQSFLDCWLVLEEAAQKKFIHVYGSKLYDFVKKERDKYALLATHPILKANPSLSKLVKSHLLVISCVEGGNYRDEEIVNFKESHSFEEASEFLALFKYARIVPDKDDGNNDHLNSWYEPYAGKFFDARLLKIASGLVRSPTDLIQLLTEFNTVSKTALNDFISILPAEALIDNVTTIAMLKKMLKMKLTDGSVTKILNNVIFGRLLENILDLKCLLNIAAPLQLRVLNCIPLHILSGKITSFTDLCLILKTLDIENVPAFLQKIESSRLFSMASPDERTVILESLPADKLKMVKDTLQKLEESPLPRSAVTLFDDYVSKEGNAWLADLELLKFLASAYYAKSQKISACSSVKSIFSKPKIYSDEDNAESLIQACDVMIQAIKSNSLKPEVADKFLQNFASFYFQQYLPVPGNQKERLLRPALKENRIFEKILRHIDVVLQLPHMEHEVSAREVKSKRLLLSDRYIPDAAKFDSHEMNPGPLLSSGNRSNIK